ncbi:PQQ-dependent sugar dehydrogenase [Natronogracilivirga saccharolytica]|uniref:PQQ-dependent sugar dehydrogenase n=1 Tax=Natronogracilivirga saccharolytica TaxID=2812953 RepID=A0A8J7RVK7_9BACT|nr:PQQ-dependent sugar dehydrogenase [Natronogracilivirga saccharolytica]MBP3193752.1 PQQ-dependent sugar dehydrogenase [Natronogracilivirga saccharolytica]
MKRLVRYTAFFIPLLAIALLFAGSSWFATADGKHDHHEDSWISNSQYAELRVSKVAGDLEHPWSIAFLPDGNMLVTERPGRLHLVENGNFHEIEGLPEIHARGQGGLLEVSVHPDYESNGWIYLTYSKPNGDDETATALHRARLDGRSLTDAEDIFVQDRYSSPGRHYGSKLAWTNDGKLLMSIGDRGTEPPRAQDLMDHAGTLLRLNDDGSVPSDNPFVGDDDALDEIYSYGHRNIQGLVVHPETGQIWVTEHGPRGGDELNLVEAGENYGWPTVTRGLDYRTQEDFPHSEARRMDGIVEPVYELLPTLAPSGLALVTNDHFSSVWEGNLFAGGLAAERIRRLVTDNPDGFYEVIHDEELLLEELGRIRDIRIGPDDNMYIVTDHSDGALWRVEPAN